MFFFTLEIMFVRVISLFQSFSRKKFVIFCIFFSSCKLLLLFKNYFDPWKELC